MSATDEDKIATVRTFHDQVMSAVLDGRELVFFDLIEHFFTERSLGAFQQGYYKGWEDAMNYAAALVERGI